MKLLVLGGVVLIVIGFFGALYFSSIFFGLFSVGLFLTAYGALVKEEAGPLPAQEPPPSAPLAASTLAEAKRFCPRCGAMLGADVIFCPLCGEKVKKG